MPLIPPDFSQGKFSWGKKKKKKNEPTSEQPKKGAIWNVRSLQNVLQSRPHETALELSIFLFGIFLLLQAMALEMGVWANMQMCWI